VAATTYRVLVAALVDRVFEVAGLAATARGGRVDPPITVMLDEAANVCRIDALLDLYSFFGSQGISVNFGSGHPDYSVHRGDRGGPG